VNRGCLAHGLLQRQAWPAGTLSVHIGWSVCALTRSTGLRPRALRLPAVLPASWGTCF